MTNIEKYLTDLVGKDNVIHDDYGPSSYAIDHKTFVVVDASEQTWKICCISSFSYSDSIPPYLTHDEIRYYNESAFAVAKKLYEMKDPWEEGKQHDNK